MPIIPRKACVFFVCLFVCFLWQRVSIVTTCLMNLNRGFHKNACVVRQAKEIYSVPYTDTDEKMFRKVIQNSRGKKIFRVHKLQLLKNYEVY